MLPLLDHFSPIKHTPIGDGAVFLTDTMNENQIKETRQFLKQYRQWNHIMASSETSFAAVSDCLIQKMDEPWSLHLNLPNTLLNHTDNLKCLMYLNLGALQLDLSPLNPLWITAFNHLNDNQIILKSLHKLQLPRYLFTQEIMNKKTAVCNAFIQFMNNNIKSSLTTISIEMDDELLPNEQQYVNDFMFINSIKFNHPIYQCLHIYCINRLRVFQCPFDIFMIIVYGLFCNQFPFLQKRSNDNIYKNDELFLFQTLRFPFNIETLTIYPPVLKKEMLLFVHSLKYNNMPSLISLEFQNWSIGQIASFCRSIQRLTSIQYERRLKKKRKRKHHKQRSNPYPLNKHKRSRSYHNKSMDLNKIIADVKGTDFRIEMLKQRALFHHIHSFKMNISTTSLFASLFVTKKNNIKGNIKIKAIEKLYCNDNEKKIMTTNQNTEYALHKKSLKYLLMMGDILRYQFSNLYEFGCNNYTFLFSSKCFMIQLLNGIAFHSFCRKLEFQGIGTEKDHAINAMDLAKVVAKSLEISQNHYIFMDKLLEKVLSSKDVRVEIMKYMYGSLYCNIGTGILDIDISANKCAARRHSIFSALQTIKRRNDTDKIHTKLDGFGIVLEALEKNWFRSALNNSNQYWEWKKNTNKIQNIRKIHNFTAM